MTACAYDLQWRAKMFFARYFMRAGAVVLPVSGSSRVRVETPRFFLEFSAHAPIIWAWPKYWTRDDLRLEEQALRDVVPWAARLVDVRGDSDAPPAHAARLDVDAIAADDIAGVLASELFAAGPKKRAVVYACWRDAGMYSYAFRKRVQNDIAETTLRAMRHALQLGAGMELALWRYWGRVTTSRIDGLDVAVRIRLIRGTEVYHSACSIIRAAHTRSSEDVERSIRFDVDQLLAEVFPSAAVMRWATDAFDYAKAFDVN